MSTNKEIDFEEYLVDATRAPVVENYLKTNPNMRKVYEDEKDSIYHVGEEGLGGRVFLVGLKNGFKKITMRALASEFRGEILTLINPQIR